MLLTCYLFLSNSSNLIVTVYSKLERHFSSTEVKFLNLQVLIAVMRHEHFSRLSSRLMGPLQLKIAWYKIHHAGEQATHWDIQNKENANAQWAACSPAWRIVCHVTASCKGPIMFLSQFSYCYNSIWKVPPISAPR